MTAPTFEILLLTPTLHTVGGVENYYNALQLDAHDRRINYFFVTGGRKESLPILFYRLIRNYLRFVKLVANSRYGLIVMNPSLNPHSFYRDAVFCWLALLRRKRILVFFRGWSEAFEDRIRRPSLARFLYRRSFMRVRHFVVLGAIFEKKLVQMGCSRESQFWIESTVADASFLSDFSIESRSEQREPIRILFLSRMVASKGATIALRAFRLASERLPDLSMELIMAGDGADLATLRSLVKTEDISNVRFTGTVSGALKKRVLFDADMLLFPTMHAEGMPNVVLEAMLYGLPIITRAVGAIPDIVKEGRNGYVTDATDPEVFADKIALLARDRELRYRIAFENHEKAVRCYSSDVVRERILRIVDSVLTS